MEALLAVLITAALNNILDHCLSKTKIVKPNSLREAVTAGFMTVIRNRLKKR